MNGGTSDGLDGALDPATSLGPWRRIVLTLRHGGPRELVLRALTFPLRATPLRGHLGVGRLDRDGSVQARRWYRHEGRPVTVVIPSFRDAELVAGLVRSIRRTTRSGRVRIVVSDDGSGPEHVAALRAIRGIELVESDRNTGFAANVNRGLRAADPTLDVVLLGSDTLVRKGWLAILQFAASVTGRTGMVGTTAIEPATCGAPAYPGVDLCLRCWQAGWQVRTAPAAAFELRGPAAVSGELPALAVGSDCMYLCREALDAIGGFDETLRPGSEVGERERVSQRYFWQRWGAFFDARVVRGGGGELRVVYVTEDTGVGGGHRVVFEHLNRLAARGHDVSLYTLADPPDWFELAVPVRTFKKYQQLIDALEPVEAIKVATWWNTAGPVWLSSVLHGDSGVLRARHRNQLLPGRRAQAPSVLASYRPEFRFVTTSGWNRERLGELGVTARVVVPEWISRPSVRFEGRRAAVRLVVAIGRTKPLKNFPLTLAAWRALRSTAVPSCVCSGSSLRPREPGVEL